MKKYIGFIVVLVIMLVVNVQTVPVRAEDGQSGVETKVKLKTEMENGRDQIRTEMNLKIGAMREDARQKMKGLRTKIKEERDTVKAKIKEERITGREKALERFDAVVLRISSLKDRVNTHITKLEARGVDVADAKSFVAIAETKLTDAKNKIAEINALLATSINELTKDDKTKLRTLAQDAQSLIKEAHQALKDAVKSLKDGIKVKMEAEIKVNQ